VSLIVVLDNCSHRPSIIYIKITCFLKQTFPTDYKENINESESSQFQKKRENKSENVFLIRVCDLIGHRADMPSLISTDRLKQSGERRNRIVQESPWSLGQRRSWETFGVVLVVVVRYLICQYGGEK